MNRVLMAPHLTPAAREGAPAGARLHALQGETMGTTWSVKLAASAALPLAELQQAIQAQLDLVVAQMSTWDPASDLSQFNRAPAGSWRELPAELFDVLSHGLALAQDTHGAYDPTAGALVDCWGFGPAARRPVPPGADEIRAACALGGWQRLGFDASRRRVQQPGGLRLDLSSIAKGYGVDRVADWLESAGLPHHLVEVGGELRGQGCKPDGQPWWVELEWPPGGARAHDPLLLALDGLAIATSGDYRSYFEADSRRYAHTLDPRTGYPVDSTLASVSVVHPGCMHADACATALTVLGVEAGLRYAQERGLAALFLCRTGQHDAPVFEEHMTPAFAAMLA